MTIHAYMAGPLFSLAEREFNANLADEIEQRAARDAAVIRCILPQDECYGKPIGCVAAQCLYDIQRSDCVVACLDGSDTDSGTAVEIAYARRLGMPVIGYRTDFRGADTPLGVNAMIHEFCSQFLDCREMDINVLRLANRIVTAVRGSVRQ